MPHSTQRIYRNHLDKINPEGTGYRARTRFAKFFNLPELMSMFKEVADIKTSDQLHLPVPEAKFETVVAKPSEIQEEMVQELSKRAAVLEWLRRDKALHGERPRMPGYGPRG